MSTPLKRLFLSFSSALPAVDDADARPGGGGRALPAAELPRREPRHRRAQATLLPLALQLCPQHLLRQERGTQEISDLDTPKPKEVPDHRDVLANPDSLI